MPSIRVLRTKDVILGLLAVPRRPLPAGFLGEGRKLQTRVRRGFSSYRIKSTPLATAIQLIPSRLIFLKCRSDRSPLWSKSLSRQGKWRRAKHPRPAATGTRAGGSRQAAGLLLPTAVPPGHRMLWRRGFSCFH